MNAPEKIVQAYLRLNDFFTIPHFSILSQKSSHIDFLAVRLGDSEERIGVEANTTLKIDDEFLGLLAASKMQTIGLVVEVKGGQYDEPCVSDEKFDYAKPFFGKVRRIFRVGFKRRMKKLEKQIICDRTHYLVPLHHCLQFIEKRFDEMKRIEELSRPKDVISKEGSWHLSEEFLSDLIYVRSLRYKRKIRLGMLRELA